MLEVLLLGAVEVRANGLSVRVGGERQRALLTLLALAEGEPVSATRLIEELWEDAPISNPHHALQSAVSRLRRVLPDRIEYVAGSYVLDLAGAAVDIHRFEALSVDGRRLVAAGDPAAAGTVLAEALALWRGEVFGGLPPLQALQTHRTRLDELWHQTTGDRIAAAMAVRPNSEVVAELHGLVATHPLREQYWEQLVMALHRSSREAEALAAYDQARRTLRDLIGTEPGPRLRRLHLQMLANDLPLPDTPAPAAELDLPSPALIGRRAELAVLTQAWQEAQDSFRVVVISGDAGMGKTHLTTEFARSVVPTSQLLVGRCDRFVSVPYEPFAQFLPDPPDHDSATGNGASPWAEPGVDQSRQFAAAVAWLEAATVGAPLVLVLDDLHWADRQSLLLLRHLVRGSGRIRALVLVTLRDREEVAPETRVLLNELTRQSETVRHFPLAGLEMHETTDLSRHEFERAGAGAELDAVLSEEVLTWIGSTSGGNPLFVVELARHVAAGNRSPDQLPTGIQQVIADRLAQLTEPTREVLRRAAVLGSPFDLQVLSCLVGSDALEPALVEAGHSRLVSWAEGRGLRPAFSHEAVRISLRDSLGPLQQATLHHQAAEAIQECHGADLRPHHSALAHHFTVAAGVVPGADVRAVHHLALAGTEAMGRRAPSVAVAHYGTAVDLLTADASAEATCDLLIRLGVAQFHAGNSGYRSTLLRASTLAHEIGDVARLTEAVVANSRGWWSSAMGIDHERVAHIEAALVASVEPDHRVQVPLLLFWALENVRDPVRRAQSLSRSDAALRLAEASGDVDLLGMALARCYSIHYAAFGDPEVSLALAERLLGLAQQHLNPGWRLIASIGIAQTSMQLGDFRVADRALDEAVELADALDQPARLWMARGWQAMRTGTRGDLATAEQLAVETYELGVATEQPDAETWFAGQIYALHHLGGRLAELVAAIESQVSAHADGIPAWRAAYGLALSCGGRTAEAERILVDFAAADFEQLPRDLLWLHGMSYLCDICDAVPRPDLAAQLYAAFEPYSGLMANNSTIDAGPVDLHLAVVARVAGDLEAAAKHLRSAEDQCRRAEAPFWLAAVEVQQAKLRNGTS